jgi:Sugar efflux transporter for intercellular exchange
VHILEHSDSKSNPRDQIIRLRVEGILISSASFWVTVAFVIGLVLKDEKHKEFKTLLVGALCDVCTLVFYAAPLTNLAEVIEKKDSSTLYAPAIGVNLLSSILWFLYGFLGIEEAVVWIPSAVGMILCMFQLYICWYYPVFLNDSFDEEIEEEFPQGDFAVFSSSRRVITPGPTPHRTPHRTPGRTPDRTPGRSPPISPSLSRSRTMIGMWLHAEPVRESFDAAMIESLSLSESIAEQDYECPTIQHVCRAVDHDVATIPHRGNVRYLPYVRPSVTGSDHAGIVHVTETDTDPELSAESEMRL